MSLSSKLRKARGTEQKAPTYNYKPTVKADKNDDPSFKNTQTFGKITPTVTPKLSTVQVDALKLRKSTEQAEKNKPVSVTKITRDKGTPTLRESLLRERAKENIVETKVEKKVRKDSKDRAKEIETQMESEYGINIRKTYSPMDFGAMIQKIPEEKREQFRSDYSDYLASKERSNPFSAGADAGINILPTMTESLAKKDERFQKVQQAKGYNAGRFVGGATQQAAFSGILGPGLESIVGKVLPKATPLVTETIKDVAIGTGTQLAEAPFDKPTTGQFVGNAAMDVALNVLFGKIGKGISGLKASDLSAGKTVDVVESVAEKLNISPQEANKVLDDAIVIYVNKSGVADTKPFEQLQLDAPKTVNVSDSQSTLASRLRAKQSDMYVNQFGVTDNKPFEQLQLEAPKNVNSDASVSRLSEKVKAVQEPKNVLYDYEGNVVENIGKTSNGLNMVSIVDENGTTNKIGSQLYTDTEFKNFIDEQPKIVENINKNKEFQAKQDLKDKQNAFETEQTNDLRGFASNQTPLQFGKTKTALLKRTSWIDVDGKNKNGTRRDFVEYQLKNKIGEPITKEVNGRTEYRIVSEDNSFYNITKTEYEYANYIKDKLDLTTPKQFVVEQPKKETIELKPQLDRPSEFSTGAKYPPLAKDFAREVPQPARPRIEPTLKPIDRPSDFSVKKPIQPTLDPKFAKERPTTLTRDDIRKPNVASKVDQPTTKIEPTLKPKKSNNVASKFEGEGLTSGDNSISSGEIKERGFSENIRTDKNRPQELQDEIDNDRLFYETLGNKTTLESAQARFDRGYDVALRDYRATSDLIRADNVPLAKMIADEATKRGDMEVAREVITKAAENLTKTGQYSQAARILRDSNDPITVMRFVNNEVKKLNEQGIKRYGKGWDTIKLNDNELDLIAKITKDSTDDQKKEAFEQVFNSMSERIPTTKREQFDSWRRIAMLFNPKTHTRNILGNALMKTIKTISDKGAQAMELTLPKDLRTKGKATKELKEVSSKYFESNKKQLLEGSRWDIFGVASPFSEKRIFKNDFLETLNDVSKKTLEKEDEFFFKSTFINDLAGFMNARGLKEPTEEAVAYALRRSQEATFRQANAVANAINGLKGTRIGLLVDAAVPFTKTPANILQTGIDYSPIGAMKSIVQILNKAEPQVAIENLSKGLTGTGLALVGAWASYNGLARGRYESNSKVEGLYNATGLLPNSIVTPGGSYTMDWAQPISMPFFMGVAFMDELKKGGSSKADAAFNALLQSGETLVDQSMLKGVKDLFGGYGTTTEKILQLPVDYVTQGFPTVAGQIARVIDPNKRQADYTNIIDSTITLTQSRTPFLSKELPVKRDILGKPQVYGKGTLNVFQQFLSPGFIGTKTDDPVLKEINRLYESEGSDFLPKAKVTSFSEEKVKYNLTTKEISEVQRIMGEYTAKQLSAVMNSLEYRNASDPQRAKMIQKVNETGYELAKKSIVEARKK